MTRSYRSRDACPGCGRPQPGDDLCPECNRGQECLCAVCGRKIVGGVHFRRVDDMGGDVHHYCEVMVLRARARLSEMGAWDSRLRRDDRQPGKPVCPTNTELIDRMQYFRAGRFDCSNEEAAGHLEAAMAALKSHEAACCPGRLDHPHRPRPERPEVTPAGNPRVAGRRRHMPQAGRVGRHGGGGVMETTVILEEIARLAECAGITSRSPIEALRLVCARLAAVKAERDEVRAELEDAKTEQESDNGKTGRKIS